MAKKRKLNSKNPKYWDKSRTEGPGILKRIHMCDAIIRNAQGKPTGDKAAVHGIWYKED